MKKLMAMLFCISSCLSAALWASTQAPQTITIKNETPSDVIDIQYPQGFADKLVDKAVLDWITKAKMAFSKPNPTETQVPADLPGKHGLYISYELKFQKNQAISLLFSQSVNEKGAAHPFNTVKTLNFIEGKPVALNALFKENSPYLSSIAQFSLTTLKKKDISDINWLKNGTKPLSKNYQNWYFSQDGLVIVFDTYQVAAYVYGPQTVTIPVAMVKGHLRPDVMKAVWGL